MRFEPLRERLLTAGVAPHHVRRYLVELSEHLDDLMAQQRDAGHGEESAARRARALLGEDSKLAAAMIDRAEFLSWAARVPWAVFSILPPCALLAVTGASLLLLNLISRLHNLVSGSLAAPQWYQQLSQCIVEGGNLVMTPLVAAYFAMMVRRQRLPVHWSLVATSMILIMFIHAQVTFPEQGRCGGVLGIEVMPVFCQPARDAIAAKWGEAGGTWLFTIILTVWLYYARRNWRPAL